MGGMSFIQRAVCNATSSLKPQKPRPRRGRPCYQAEAWHCGFPKNQPECERPSTDERATDQAFLVQCVQLPASRCPLCRPRERDYTLPVHPEGHHHRCFLLLFLGPCGKQIRIAGNWSYLEASLLHQVCGLQSIRCSLEEGPADRSPFRSQQHLPDDMFPVQSAANAKTLRKDRAKISISEGMGHDAPH